MIISRDDRARVDGLVAQALAGEDAFMVTTAAIVAKQALDPMLKAIFPEDEDLPIEQALYAIRRMGDVAARLQVHWPEVRHPLLLKGLLISLAAAGVGGEEESFQELMTMLDGMVERELDKVDEGEIESALSQASASEAN